MKMGPLKSSHHAANNAPDKWPQLAQWARIRGKLQSEVGDVEYRTWLRQMTLAGVDGDEVTVHLPTRFLRDWVRSHYGEKIEKLWQDGRCPVHPSRGYPRGPWPPEPGAPAWTMCPTPEPCPCR